MSLQEALKENSDLKQENAYLKFELDRMKKLIFGSKKERFTTEENPLQLSLFSNGESAEVELPAIEKQHISYRRIHIITIFRESCLACNELSA